MKISQAEQRALQEVLAYGEAFAVIYRCEKQALGHGADLDRALLVECAQWLRTFMGLSLTDPLPYPAPPSPYGPVQHEPPIGWSLPDSPEK